MTLPRAFGHPLRDLPAFVDGAVTPAREREIAAHLDACDGCRGQLERLRSARRALAGELTPRAMPDHAAAAVRDALVDRSLRRAPPLPRWAIAASAVLLTGAAVWQLGRPWIGVREAPDDVSAIEALARRIHADAGAAVPLAFESASPAAIRGWLDERRAPPAKLADGEGRAAFAPRGASVVRAAEQDATLVRYNIDGRAVTLITARAGTIAGAPASWPLSKTIFHRLDSTTGALTWTTGGQTYALVSDLPGRGLRACLICHADERFERAIDAQNRPAPYKPVLAR